VTEPETIEEIIAALSKELVRTGQQVLIRKNGTLQYLKPQKGFL
jgi:hypothetical protein